MVRGDLGSSGSVSEQFFEWKNVACFLKGKYELK